MKKKITTRVVKSLVPQDKAYDVFDTSVIGFLIRVQPSGVMTYYLAYKNEQGRGRRFRIGPHGNLSVAQARDFAESCAARVAMGVDIQEERGRSRRDAERARLLTLRGFIDGKYANCRNVKASGKRNA